MLIYEYKLDGSKHQYVALDEAIRITQFIRNKCLRLWMDTRGSSKNDLQCYCAVLAKVQRQREDFARKTASTLISSSDLIAYEQLKIRNLVRNRKLAKSISDASWGRFLSWLTYYGMVHGIAVIAVEPAFTSQDCSGCGTRVKKSLSIRTHICSGCGLVLGRDQNAAINILAKAYRTGGHSETGAPVSVQNASGQTASTTCSEGASGK